MHLQEVGWEGIDRIDLAAQDRQRWRTVLKTVPNLCVL
jgi:hypothetical protein